MNGLLRVLMVLTLFVVSCGDDSTTDPIDEGAGYPIFMPNLSGRWTGTLDLERTGDCTINGMDMITFDVTILIQMGREGRFDTFVDPYALPNEAWKGTTATDLTVTLEKSFEFPCPDETHVERADYTGRFEVLGELDYRLVIESEEEWCPNLGCTFLSRYTLVKNENEEDQEAIGRQLFRVGSLERDPRRRLEPAHGTR